MFLHQIGPLLANVSPTVNLWKEKRRGCETRGFTLYKPMMTSLRLQTYNSPDTG